MGTVDAGYISLFYLEMYHISYISIVTIAITYCFGHKVVNEIINHPTAFGVVLIKTW